VVISFICHPLSTPFQTLTRKVTAKVRPLNLLKCCGGSLIVGGGDKRSGTWDNNNNNSYSSVSSGSNSNGTVLGSSSSSSPEIDGMKLANSSSSDLVSALGGVADSFLENGEPSPYTSFRARAGFGSQDSSGSSSGEGSDDDDDEEEGTVTGASAVRHVNRQSGQNHSSSSRGSSSSSSRGSSSGGTFSASSSSYNYSHGSNLANDESASLLSETAGHRPRHTPSSSSSSSSSTANSPHYISGKDPEKLRARKAIAQIVKSPLYLWTVTTGAVISGSVAFILYFITQVGLSLSLFLYLSLISLLVQVFFFPFERTLRKRRLQSLHKRCCELCMIACNSSMCVCVFFFSFLSILPFINFYVG